MMETTDGGAVKNNTCTVLMTNVSKIMIESSGEHSHLVDSTIDFIIDR